MYLYVISLSQLKRAEAAISASISYPRLGEVSGSRGWRCTKGQLAPEGRGRGLEKVAQRAQRAQGG